jgi:hypothetical protein
MADTTFTEAFDHAFVGLMPGCEVLLRKTGESEGQQYSLAEFWCLLRREGLKCITPLLLSESCDQPEFCGFPEEFCIFEFIQAATAAALLGDSDDEEA